MLAITSLQVPASAMEKNPSGLSVLKERVETIWGDDNVWLPTATVWVQYEPDLGERHAVDFEAGVASVQILLRADDDPGRDAVKDHFRQGVTNLILRDAADPVDMITREESLSAPDGSPPSLPPEREIRIYLTRSGDSLWKIARQFDMPLTTLAEINGLDGETMLPIGLPLKVAVFTSHDLTLDSAPRPTTDDPLLLNQIRMADGSPVPPWMVQDFADEVVGNQALNREKIVGNDGVERLAVTATFQLVSNHLEVRARRFHPLVLAHAAKMNLDPALIMAIIHTESMFNPYARSETPAFGLMQVVPHTAGREAYRKVYGRKGTLTSQYLFDPANNVELGVPYVSLLKNRYMKSIVDSAIRAYCAVAAYNAGASNVGKAFISKKSIRRAIPAINRLTPTQVYDRLVTALPMKESRDYVRKVMERIDNYRDWH